MPPLPYSYIPGKKDCPICGIVSFAHEHPVDTKPKDFVTDDLKLCPGCTTMKHISDDGLECARCMGESVCGICREPLEGMFGTCLCLPVHSPWHFGCSPHSEKTFAKIVDMTGATDVSKALNDLDDPEEEEKDWWMKYAEGNWIGLSSIPEIIEIATKRGIEQERSRVKSDRCKDDSPHHYSNCDRDIPDSLTQ